VGWLVRMIFASYQTPITRSGLRRQREEEGPKGALPMRLLRKVVLGSGSRRHHDPTSLGALIRGVVPGKHPRGSARRLQRPCPRSRAFKVSCSLRVRRPTCMPKTLADSADRHWQAPARESRAGVWPQPRAIPGLGRSRILLCVPVLAAHWPGHLTKPHCQWQATSESKPQAAAAKTAPPLSREEALA
jgi:hypothetical protein